VPPGVTSSGPDTTSSEEGMLPPYDCSRLSRVAAGPPSTAFHSSSAVDRMISFARITSVTPGSCTRI